MRKRATLASLATVFTFVLSTATPAATTVSRNVAEVRQLLDRWEKAFREKNVDAVMAVYAPGNAVIAFDVIPHLQRVGRENYRKNYEDFFAMYEGPLDVQFRDLRIVAAKMLRSSIASSRSAEPSRVDRSPMCGCV